MYKDNIQRLITQSPLEIDTEIQMAGRPPTMANSEFLTNKEQGDWAEQIVYKAINEFSDEFFAVESGRSESIAAGDEGFADFYMEYQNELNTIGKKPDLLIFKLTDFPDRNVDIENDEHVKKAIATIKVNAKVGKEVIGKIDLPEHKSAMKELDRGRLLFYVTFKGGKGYLDHDVFVRDIINA